MTTQFRRRAAVFNFLQCSVFQCDSDSEGGGAENEVVQEHGEGSAQTSRAVHG